MVICTLTGAPCKYADQPDTGEYENCRLCEVYIYREVT